MEIQKVYEELYKDSCVLGYVDPQRVFDDYFADTLPFSGAGRKKSEFPDAFVIEAIKDFTNEHSNDIVLVISKDNDWIKALSGTNRIVICNSIIDSMKEMNSIDSILSEDMQEDIFQGAREDIIECAREQLEYECYELNDLEALDDLTIDNIEIKKVSNDYVPLKMTRDKISIIVNIEFIVSGTGEVFDNENSIWDSEDKEYITTEYSDVVFSNGHAEVGSEVGITFDFDRPKETAKVVDFRLNNAGNIIIDSNDVDYTPINEDELAIRDLREDKGYSRKWN